VSESAITYSVIVPCYNEEEAVGQTMERLLANDSDSSTFEILAINDGSTDGTRAILEQYAQQYPNIHLLNHATNQGYGASLKTGIRKARGELIAITDADGTYPNERLPELVAACEEYDMVVGARTADDVTYSKLRAAPKFFLQRWMSWIARQHIPDINSGMRVFRKSVAERFIGILPDGFSFTVTITLAMLTNYRPTLFVPIAYRQRVGQSKLRPIHDTLRFVALILRTGTYFAPLRVFFPFVGLLFLMVIASLLYDIVHLGNLTDKTVLLFLFALNAGMFALLADMIDKRSMR
jgi:glycosyltransferase involved in cell wall biosynthesis